MQSKIYLSKLLQRSDLISQITFDIKNYIYVRSKWLENEVDFTFLVTVNNECYRSRLTTGEFKAAAAEFDKNYQEFYDECKQALTAHLSQPGFDYEIDTQEMIFRLIRCQGFKTVYLELILHKMSHLSVYDMFDSAIEMLDKQDHQSTDNTLDAKVMEEYQAYVVESKKTELLMLKKFMLLLNSKKSKIRELEAQLERRSGDTSDTDLEMAQDTEPDETLENAETSNNAALDDTIYTDQTQALSPPSTSAEA